MSPAPTANAPFPKIAVSGLEKSFGRKRVLDSFVSLA